MSQPSPCQRRLFLKFELTLNEPGQYLLVDHALYRVSKGAAGVLMVSGAWNPGVYLQEAPGASH